MRTKLRELLHVLASGAIMVEASLRAGDSIWQGILSAIAKSLTVTLPY
jgi:hypothetical protein